MAENNNKKWWLLAFLIPIGYITYLNYKYKNCNCSNKTEPSSGSLGTNVYDSATPTSAIPNIDATNTKATDNSSGSLGTNVFSSGSLGTNNYYDISGSLGTAYYLSSGSLGINSITSASLGLNNFTSWYRADGWWFNK
jgi:hypothetical protein